VNHRRTGLVHVYTENVETCRQTHDANYDAANTTHSVYHLNHNATRTGGVAGLAKFVNIGDAVEV